MTRIKICGITRAEDAISAASLGVGALGFIFSAGSPRCVSPEKAAAIIDFLPPFVHRVGVFVSTPAPDAAAIIRQCRLDVAQLHGDEDNEYCLLLKKYCKIIKVIRVRDERSVSATEQYAAADAFLFDSYSATQRGGTGVPFNHNFLRGKCFGKPVIISGGITPENVTQVIRALNPYAVDCSSGVEDSPGIKNPQRILALVENVAAMRQGGGAAMSDDKNKLKHMQKITEQQIKEKLYGGAAAPQAEPSAPPAAKAAPQSAPVPQPALTPAARTPSPHAAAPGAAPAPAALRPAAAAPAAVDLFAGQPRIDADIKREMEALKHAVQSLEEKLTAAEKQKERLLKKLLAKRRSEQTQQFLATQVFGKLPEHINKLLAAAVVVLLIALFWPDKKQTPPPDRSPEPRQGAPASPRPQPAPTTIPKKPPQAAATAPAADSEPASGVKRYTLQVAEYANKEAAVKFVQSLEAFGYDVFMVEIPRANDPGKLYYKVNVGAFYAFADAKSFLAEFSAKTGIKDAFIKEKKE
ncbi:MAG: phosphoribosylanthranilate isomerase [Candidatus Omnitrophica bacterium]|nr:phosphoribosylanthranilate isomerase [Candidatus Omnitrophota bacterium]